MSSIYDNIKEFIISLGFVEQADAKRFVKTITQPGQVQTIIVNGQRSEQRSPDRVVELTISYLGEGAILDIDNVPVTPLYGYNMAGNDIWVETLEDFQFWIKTIAKE